MLKRRLRLSNAVIALAIIIFGVIGYTFLYLSYRAHLEKQISEKRQLLERVQQETTESLNHFKQFLNLTETRLKNSPNEEDKIVQSLSLRTGFLLNKNFPEIQNITFRRTNRSDTIYTPLGKSVTNNKEQLTTLKDEIILLPKRNFRITKNIFKEKEHLGCLTIEFSLNDIISISLKGDALTIKPFSRRTKQDDLLSFNTPDSNYFYSLNWSPPTFVQFILIHKVYILSILTVCFVFLFLGISNGYLSFKKKMRKQRSLNRALERALDLLKETNRELEENLAIKSSFITLSKSASKERDLLSNQLHERYRQMSSHALAMSSVVAELISEEATRSEPIKKILNITLDSNKTLRMLNNRTPMKGNDTNVTIIQSINRVKSIFLPDFQEKSTRFEINGDMEAVLLIDQPVFEGILHSIFSIVLSRCIKNNIFKIAIEKSDHLHIIFYDDGYDIEEKLNLITEHNTTEDILYLNKARLRNFVTTMGWMISFKTMPDSLNVIKLTLPIEVPNEILPGKVVNMSSYKNRTE